MARVRFTFLGKCAAAVGLIVLADWLFQDAIRSWLGGFALIWLLAACALRPAMRRGVSLVAAGVATGFAGVLVFDPGLLAWTLFWCALSVAALGPRTAGFDDAGRWAVRLAAHAATGPFTPAFDLVRLFAPRPRRGRLTIGALAGLLAVPLGLGAVFVALFASANPLIAHAFAAIRWPTPGEVFFWLAVTALVWPALRPSRWATRAGALLPATGPSLPELAPASVLIALALFNALFAVPNALDLAFLWSGAPLPAGVTLADYAHQGAYPLIATAILAGLFVLVALRPGSATAADPTVRRLVVLWVAQNLLLVASSVLRTCDYIAAFELTRLRIAALLWMALVALGLVLILWRMLAGKSARWLINANALAAVGVLAVSSVVDWGATAAMWNVAHAKEVTGSGPALDLCYLDRLGGSALPALLTLERTPLPPALHARVVRVRQDVLTGDWTHDDDGLAGQQAHWRRWTLRGAMRLAQAQAVLGPAALRHLSPAANVTWSCDGIVTVTPPAPAPLTTAPRP